jgi:hypothetical protein
MAMTSVNVTVELPESLVEQARAAGILSNERIAALLEMELAREAAWERLYQTAGIVRESASAEYGALSDDEVMQLVDEEIHIMRAEEQAKTALRSDDPK